MLEGKTPAAFRNLRSTIPPFVYLLLIIVFSLIKYFFPNSSQYLVLSKNSLITFSSLFLNVFVEDKIHMFITNIIFSFVLVKFMLKYWPLSLITFYTYPIAGVSNMLSFLILSTINSGMDIHGAISMNISFSCLLCYLAREEKRNITNGFGIYPSEIFYLIFFSQLILICPAIIVLSSILSAIITFSVLFYLKPGNEYTRNDNFTWRSLITSPRRERDSHSSSNPLIEQHDDIPRIPSILNSLENDGNQTLSEAEQNRRLRALRAIEERLATANRH